MLPAIDNPGPDTMTHYLLAGAACALALGLTLTQIDQSIRILTSLLFLASGVLSMMAAWRRRKG